MKFKRGSPAEPLIFNDIPDFLGVAQKCKGFSAVVVVKPF